MMRTTRDSLVKIAGLMSSTKTFIRTHLPASEAYEVLRTKGGSPAAREHLEKMYLSAFSPTGPAIGAAETAIGDVAKHQIGVDASRYMGRGRRPFQTIEQGTKTFNQARELINEGKDVKRILRTQG